MFNLSKIGYKIFKDLQEDRLNPLDAAVAGHIANKIDKAVKKIGFPDQNASRQQLDEYKNEAVRSRLFGEPMKMPNPIFATTDKAVDSSDAEGVTHQLRFAPNNEAQAYLMKLFNAPTEGPSQVIVKSSESPISQGGIFTHESSHAYESPTEVYNEELYQPNEIYDTSIYKNNYLGRGTEIRARLKELQYYDEVLKKAQEDDDINASNEVSLEISRVLRELTPFLESYKNRNADTNTTLYDKYMSIPAFGEMVNMYLERVQ